MAMIEMERGDYGVVEAALREIPINTLFARSVVEGHVPGRVWVDDVHEPRAYYVAHPYGMSLLFGSSSNHVFEAALGRYLTGEEPGRQAEEWLQVFPDHWSGVLEAMLGERLVIAGSERVDGHIVRDTRVNFRFDRARYAELKESLRLPPGCTIGDDAAWIFERMQGSVVPHRFWASATELREQGAARAVLVDGELASAAFASFVIDDQLELGIETVESFRGRGLAVLACSALIDHCLAQGLEPVWACRLGNVGSYRLALQLGFVHTRSLPYYRLPRTSGPARTTLARGQGISTTGM